MGGWTDGWMDVWTEEWMDIRMDGWMKNLSSISTKHINGGFC